METVIECPANAATILACRKIAKSFRENIYELFRIREQWNPAYATSLKSRIDDAFRKYYLKDFSAISDEKYHEWHEVMASGLQNLKVLRAALKVDFKEDKQFLKETFNKLGYSEYFEDAKSGDYLSFYKLLSTFSENLDAETRNKITAKGIPHFLIDKVCMAAEKIEDYRCCMESLISESNLKTDAQQEITGIYETIRDICTIARAYYQFDPVKRDKFDFYKVMVKLKPSDN